MNSNELNIFIRRIKSLMLSRSKLIRHFIFNAIVLSLIFLPRRPFHLWCFAIYASQKGLLAYLSSCSVFQLQYLSQEIPSLRSANFNNSQLYEGRITVDDHQNLGKLYDNWHLNFFLSPCIANNAEREQLRLKRQFLPSTKWMSAIC
jgi:hypothetical protein